MFGWLLLGRVERGGVCSERPSYEELAGLVVEQAAVIESLRGEVAELKRRLA